VVGSGPHQYVQIARALGGRRSVTAISLPGSRTGEPLPASWSAAMDVLVESVASAAEGEPFALVAYSSGAAIAQALVERLELEGSSPIGLATIDAYLPEEGGMVDAFATFMGALLEMDHEAVAIDDDHLITMGAYIRLLADWEPGSIETPTLTIRASEREEVGGSAGDSIVTGQAEETTVEVGGTHFSLIGDEAGATADALESWLASGVRLPLGER
jgi:hypothetical protein